MLHMERVGIRELRQRASELLRRVAGGETFEITDRGRPVALLVKAAARGLEQLEREGVLRRGGGELLELEPVPVPKGAVLPSEMVSRGRDD
jgi:prevent-host-death family protein